MFLNSRSTTETVPLEGPSSARTGPGTTDGSRTGASDPPSAGARWFDLLVAVPMAVATLPLVVVLAIGSAVAFRARPLFVQTRLGRGGEHFRFVKVRSLPPGAPATADKYAIQQVQNNAWGRFLRRTHLDELPQLWLVVQGSMSLVGPRPEMPSLSDTFDQEFVHERLTVRPGCTGLWQVSRSVGGLIGEHPEYDLHYVRHRTLRLDVWILVTTVKVIVKRRAVATLDSIPRWTGAAPARRDGAV